MEALEEFLQTAPKKKNKADNRNISNENVNNGSINIIKSTNNNTQFATTENNVNGIDGANLDDNTSKNAKTIVIDNDDGVSIDSMKSEQSNESGSNRISVKSIQLLTNNIGEGEAVESAAVSDESVASNCSADTTMNESVVCSGLDLNGDNTLKGFSADDSLLISDTTNGAAEEGIKWVPQGGRKLKNIPQMRKKGKIR